MAVVKEQLDALVRDYVAPVMKECGFKKAGRTWFLDEDFVVRFIQLQASAWNMDDSIRFTLNLGAWYPAVDETPPPANRQRPPFRCTACARIGELMPGPEFDPWWDLVEQGGVDVVGPQVVAAIRELALPWLERVSRPPGAIRYLIEENIAPSSGINALAISVEYEGASTAAERYYEWAARWNDVDNHTKAWVHSWAAGHGLTL